VFVGLLVLRRDRRPMLLGRSGDGSPPDALRVDACTTVQLCARLGRLLNREARESLRGWRVRGTSYGVAMAERMSLLRSIEVVVLEEGMRLYRVCRAREDAAFVDGLRSHYEQGLLPRGPENRAAVVHMALSMFDAPSVAAQLARRVPKLGGHVATLDLQPGVGLCVAKTGGPAHWSVWGRPLQLESCVTDVVEATG
jgi:hypothetical protein